MKTTLYDYITLHHNDFDTCDTDYDITVTVCEPYDEPEDNYDRFCIEMMKKVDVVEVNENVLVVNWSELIENNLGSFKEFTRRHWKANCQYEDDHDEFVYQWIREIHYYFAGYGDEGTYTDLVEMIEEFDEI